MDRNNTKDEDQMMVIRYFKHLKISPASSKDKIGFSVGMSDFLHTVKMGKQQTIRRKTKSTQTDETRSLSPSIFSDEFRNRNNIH